MRRVRLRWEEERSVSLVEIPPPVSFSGLSSPVGYDLDASEAPSTNERKKKKKKVPPSLSLSSPSLSLSECGS